MIATEIPLEMHIPRKSLEIPTLNLPKLNYLASFIYNDLSYLYKGKERDKDMDIFWAKELVATELFYANGMSYKEYLPGRHLTYKRLSDIIKRLIDIKGRSIIEMGCGSGLALVMLAKDGAKCTGLDKSHVALEFLRRNAEKEDITNISRDFGDFFHTDYEGNQFNVSFNFGVFEHLNQEEQKALIKEVARITKDIILIAIPNSNSPLFKTLLYNEQELESIAPGNIYPDRKKHYYVDLRNLLDFAGFEIAEDSGILVAPSKNIKPELMDQEAINFFDNLPKMLPLGDKKEKIDNLIKFWECVEKAASPEDLRKYAWARYVVGKKK